MINPYIKMVLLAGAYLSLLMCPLSAVEPVRTWTSSDGRTLQARMLSSQEDSVTIMTTIGQTYVVPFEKLSESDVKYVKAKQVMAEMPEYEGGWLEDFEDAKTIAAAHKKPILMLFTGSDWCGYCINLENKVLSTKKFKAFAKEELVLMMVDFPARKAQKRSLKKANASLKNVYGVGGYPTMFLVDEKGKELSQFGYGGQSAEAFISLLKGKIP